VEELSHSQEIAGLFDPSPEDVLADIEKKSDVRAIM
jgi:hypothetical protein